MKFFLPFKYINNFVYNVYSPRGIVDPYVEQAMKRLVPDIYEEAQYYTKSGATKHELTEILTEIVDTDRSFIPELSDLENRSYYYGCLKTLSQFQRAVGKVEPFSLEDTIECLTMNTAAGAGYLGKKKGDVIDEIYDQARGMFYNAVNGVPQLAVPCMIGTRMHLRKRSDSKKRRMTFIVPAAIVALEMMFTKPILETLKANQRDSPMFFGKKVLKRLKLFTRKQYGVGSSVMKADFSKFDRTIPVFLLRDAFLIIRQLINFDTWKGKRLSPSAKLRYSRVFDMLEEYFITTPVMNHDGRLFTIEGMIMSGSGFTQLIGSIINAIVLNTVSIHSGIGQYDLKVLGDDGYVALTQRPDLEKWSEWIREWFGMNLSVTKTALYSGVSSDRGFLGYEFKNGVLNRPTQEWFNMALYPGSKIASVQLSFSRLVAFMFIGGINDLKFQRFYYDFQTGYEILPEWDFEFTREMKRKAEYGGQDIPVKKLVSYTNKDFLFYLTD